MRHLHAKERRIVFLRRRRFARLLLLLVLLFLWRWFAPLAGAPRAWAFGRPGIRGLFGLPGSDHVPDHLGDGLVLLRFALQALLQGAALTLHYLQQESFAFA